MCVLNNVVPTEAKLWGRTGEEEENGEEAGSTAQGYPGEREEQEGVSGHGNKTGESPPGAEGSLLSHQWQWDVHQQSHSFPPPNHPVSPPFCYQNQCK